MIIIFLAVIDDISCFQLGEASHTVWSNVGLSALLCSLAASDTSTSTIHLFRVPPGVIQEI